MLENPPQHIENVPRANLVAVSPVGARLVEVWMGGAHTTRGTVITNEDAARSIIFDCAGDLPSNLREAAHRFQSCVFLDIEERPLSFPRLNHLVDELLEDCSRHDGPERVYALCTHGMNRSGLVAGLFLRRMGLDHADALARIRMARPGALSNQTFARLLADG